VQDNTVPSHNPLLDVRPRGRNQDKPGGAAESAGKAGSGGA